MSRRRRRSRLSGGGSPPRIFIPREAPQRFYNRFLERGPLPPYLPPRSRASPTLVHPARPRTVRPLIRTVLTDTRPRSATRNHLDVSRRARLRSRSTFTPHPSMVNQWFGDNVWVEQPPLQRSITCARRSIRREVLFAIAATGKGSGASFRRYTKESKTRC